MATKKTAARTAKSPRNGAEIPLGAHPGNTGGKKGRSGRKPDAFKALCADLADRAARAALAQKILETPDHPAWLGAWRFVAEQAYGKPTQPVSANVDGSVTVRFVHE